MTSALNGATTRELRAMEFLDIGQHCSEPTCHQLDFLPFKCASCKLNYCSQHFRPSSGHRCPDYDTAQLAVQVPVCPLCQQSVNISKGQDPNVPMDRHLTTECAVLLPSGLARKKPPNACAYRKCATKLTAVKIHCSKCNKDFCSSHRFEKDHACKGPKASIPSSSALTSSSAPSTSTNRKRSSSKSGLAALAKIRTVATRAIDKAGSSSASRNTVIEIPSDTSDADSDVELLTSSARKPTDSTKPKQNQSHSSNIEIIEKSSVSKTKASLPSFSTLKASSTDSKRVKEERKSQMKALANRAQKGLLTQDEKVQYATLKAIEAKKGNGGDDSCLLV